MPQSQTCFRLQNQYADRETGLHIWFQQKNKEKQTDVGSAKGVACFMTLVFKD